MARWFMTQRYLQLNDVTAYSRAFGLSNYVWEIVMKWDYFAKDTVGKQYVRAIDSISANIAEGFGRYGKKDKINFYRYAYGSIKEAVDWTEKARVRKLLSEQQYNRIQVEFSELPREVNGLIKLTNEKLTI